MTTPSRRSLLAATAAVVGASFAPGPVSHRGAAVAADAADAADDPPAVVSRAFVYDAAPFPSVHASTIAEAPGGRLVAAFFGGTAEGRDDVGIWVSRRDGTAWSPPERVATGVQADGTRHPCWNPVLHAAAGGPLLLFYKVGPKPNSWWGMLTTSADGGRTWSPPRRLPDGILGPVKNKPVALPGGTLLCPSSTEHDGWRIHMEFTPDGGRTFTKTGPLNAGTPLGLIQPTVLTHGGKHIALCRPRVPSWVYALTSADGGKTWSDPRATDLPNPGSGIDGVTLADGRSVLAYNHTVVGRSPLNLAVSADVAAWRPALVLERDTGEYSYPAVVQSADGLVHVTYTWKRQRVRHVVIDPRKL